MTLITFQDGGPILTDGKIGTEQACCCDDCACPDFSGYCSLVEWTNLGGNCTGSNEFEGDDPSTGTTAGCQSVVLEISCNDTTKIVTLKLTWFGVPDCGDFSCTIAQFTKTIDICNEPLIGTHALAGGFFAPCVGCTLGTVQWTISAGPC
jgi:hypothetical protein